MLNKLCFPEFFGKDRIVILVENDGYTVGTVRSLDLISVLSGCVAVSYAPDGGKEPFVSCDTWIHKMICSPWVQRAAVPSCFYFCRVDGRVSPGTGHTKSFKQQTKVFLYCILLQLTAKLHCGGDFN